MRDSKRGKNISSEKGMRSGVHLERERHLEKGRGREDRKFTKQRKLSKGRRIKLNFGYIN